MADMRRFGKIEGMDCFEDGVNNILYFPITDSKDFPLEIRGKAEEIINCIVHTNGLDISKLCLCARMVVYADKGGKWSYEISIVISDNSAFDGTWIEEEYIIGRDDSLYEQFKTYFMRRLEGVLFGV